MISKHTKSLNMPKSSMKELTNEYMHANLVMYYNRISSIINHTTFYRKLNRLYEGLFSAILCNRVKIPDTLSLRASGDLCKTNILRAQKCAIHKYHFVCFSISIFSLIFLTWWWCGVQSYCWFLSCFLGLAITHKAIALNKVRIICVSQWGRGYTELIVRK